MNFIPKITYTELVTGTPKTIIFSSEPEGDPLREEYRFQKRTTRSSSGTAQTQFNYTIKRFRIKFTFESEAIKDAVLDLLLNHAIKGGEFNYFISEDEAPFEVFEYVQRSFKLSRPIPNGSGDFEYDFELRIERVES